MTEQNPLERRYRHWLRLYPRSFRAEHQDEMLGVLLAGADPGRTRPRLGEVADLVRHGLERRARTPLPAGWSRSRARVIFRIRVIIAVWLCFISTMLISLHAGELWLFVLIPAIVIHGYLAYRLRHPIPGR